ncbi:MAG: 4Fe-4S dicluster domain-containing protein, partial [Fimbriimonas sp.]
MADRDLIDLTSHCIRCGLCLETCPTFSETGEETASPRGRIYLVRSAAEGKLVWEDIEAPISQCLGCRACETACPSGVEYGAILELSRDRLGKGKRSLARKLLLQTITHPALLRLQMRLSEPFGGKTPGLVSQLLAGAKPEADMPQEGPKPNFPPLTESALPPVRGEVYLLEGCAMRV